MVNQSKCFPNTDRTSPCNYTTHTGPHITEHTQCDFSSHGICQFAVCKEVYRTNQIKYSLIFFECIQVVQILNGRINFWLVV